MGWQPSFNPLVGDKPVPTSGGKAKYTPANPLEDKNYDPSYFKQDLAQKIVQQKQQQEQQKTQVQQQAKQSAWSKVGHALATPGRLLGAKLDEPLAKQQNRAADQAVQQQMQYGIPNTTPSEIAAANKNLPSVTKPVIGIAKGTAQGATQWVVDAADHANKLIQSQIHPAKGSGILDLQAKANQALKSGKFSQQTKDLVNKAKLGGPSYSRDAFEALAAPNASDASVQAALKRTQKSEKNENTAMFADAAQAASAVTGLAGLGKTFAAAGAPAVEEAASGIKPFVKGLVTNSASGAAGNVASTLASNPEANKTDLLKAGGVGAAFGAGGTLLAGGLGKLKSLAAPPASHGVKPLAQQEKESIQALADKQAAEAAPKPKPGPPAPHPIETIKTYSGGGSGFSTPDKEFAASFADKTNNGKVAERSIKQTDVLDTRVPEQRAQLEGVLGKDKVTEMIDRTKNGLPAHTEAGEQDALVQAAKDLGYKHVALSETDKQTQFKGREVVSYADTTPKGSLKPLGKKPSGPLEDLKAEALKYKSAEEFAQKNGLEPESIYNDSKNPRFTEDTNGHPALVANVPIEDFGKPKFTTLNQNKYQPGRKITSPIEAELVDGKYVITDGANRFTQAVANGDKTIPVAVSGKEISDLYNQAHATAAPETPNSVASIGEGETKTSKLASGVEAKAIEAKLTKGFGELPEYKTVNMKEQAQHASGLLAKDEEQAVRIALGHEDPPKGVLPESVFVAVEQKALKDGNVDLLRQLASSSRTGEATLMGQRIRTLAERSPDSPIAAIQKVTDARKAAAEERLGQPVNKAIADAAKEIKAAVKTPTKMDWNMFVESIKC